MAIRIVEQGIQAIQGGQQVEGARLLRIALKEDGMDARLRATALMWLAETNEDVSFKIDCYRKAITADPDNPDVQQRLSYWLSRQLPNNQPQQPSQANYQQPTPPPTMPPGMVPPGMAPPATMPNSTVPSAQALNVGQQGTTPNQGAMPIQGQQRVVGVLGGPFGDGSGFFVTRDGLVATTRAVVGGQSRMNIDLISGHRLVGEVVRSFPEHDVALIKVNAALGQIPTVSPSPFVPESTPIVLMMHGGKGIRSQRRSTRDESTPHWFPTLVKRAEIDAGGDPIYDERNLLIGMATRNTSRTNDYIYGLHISLVFQCVEQYTYELQQTQGQRTTYCAQCGHISRAPQYSAFYCETCGSVLPASKDVTRYPQTNTDALYQENMHRPCIKCQAQVGYYDSRCLRCGHDMNEPVQSNQGWQR
ncbi:trypsin-like peptidase domain-containing protein [Phototrophicus methaneseepsis]|uniref:Trypsin-like peptidase domain-containing protein n=1 Tax=Phototrophicus methaneseepsis TaxID=2710758 RepID=A0A7S8E8B4_9CHLR|nr:trypsin-like peptidase domain-containing protein [Phototrophicus methaneseepsis]QPC82207.1 trypsin-like peptidase domain-containing protein [Phototrophicus methaneseepsis]